VATHDRFDLDRWIAEFPLARLRDEGREFVLRRRDHMPQEYADEQAVAAHIELMQPKWEIVVGPADVAINEQLRGELIAAGERPERRVPTDVAVWAKGEPSSRAVTKVGGLPYRPLDAPWPGADAGHPLRFVGQLSFVDSRDILADLPGDVLLIFGDDDALLAEPERLRFEWWSLTTAPLLARAPAVDQPLAPFYAALHRTEDWNDTVFEGTKIGGVPNFIQDEEVPSGRFIGTLGSISVPTDRRHPFVNVAAPRGWSRDNDLMIGDMGCLYLFMESNGTILPLSQCY
jgi:hypothetical protein